MNPIKYKVILPLRYLSKKTLEIDDYNKVVSKHRI